MKQTVQTFTESLFFGRSAAEGIIPDTAGAWFFNIQSQKESRIEILADSPVDQIIPIAT